MPQFMLLLRDVSFPPPNATQDEVMAIIERYRAWIQSASGAGNKLLDGEGRVLRRNGAGNVHVTDGPFAEAKEIVGGYFIVDVPSYEDAVAIARKGPHLEFGSIEIRAVDRTS